MGKRSISNTPSQTAASTLLCGNNAALALHWVLLTCGPLRLQAQPPARGICATWSLPAKLLLAPATCMHATPAGGETLFSTQLAHLAAVNACP